MKKVPSLAALCVLASSCTDSTQEYHSPLQPLPVPSSSSASSFDDSLLAKLRTYESDPSLQSVFQQPFYINFETFTDEKTQFFEAPTDVLYLVHMIAFANRPLRGASFSLDQQLYPLHIINSGRSAYVHTQQPLTPQTFAPGSHYLFIQATDVDGNKAVSETMFTVHARRD